MLVLTVGSAIGIAMIPSSFFLTYIGTENLYLFMFFIAFVGSISTFASIPYPLILISLSSAGGNPLYLGLASALGVILSDSSTFFAVRRGKMLLHEKLTQSIEYLGGIVSRYPKLVSPGLLLYGTASPLSNDFAVITFSLMRYSYVRVILPLAIGNVIYNVTLAYVGGDVASFLSGMFS